MPVWTAHADGAALRKALALAPSDGIGAENGAHWDIRLHTTAALDRAVTEEGPSVATQAPTPTPTDLSWIERRLTWQYPYREQSALASKVSATALNQNGHASLSPLEPIELGASNRPLSGAALGTAVHLALYHLRRPDFTDEHALTERLDALVNQGILTPAQRAAIGCEPLLQFGQSDVAQRMLCAHRVLREQPFTVQIPARWTEPAADPHAMVLLQGIIDCAFYEQDGWVLLDYKTNRMPAGGLQELADLYQIQIDVYRYALEQITKAPVHQAWLCLVNLGKNMEMPVREDSILHCVP